MIGIMLYLDAEDNSKPISMYINSPGGSVTSGFAIFDTMQHIKCDVSTINIGLAASMGELLPSLASEQVGRIYGVGMASPTLSRGLPYMWHGSEGLGLRPLILHAGSPCCLVLVESMGDRAHRRFPFTCGWHQGQATCAPTFTHDDPSARYRPVCYSRTGIGHQGMRTRPVLPPKTASQRGPVEAERVLAIREKVVDYYAKLTGNTKEKVMCRLSRLSPIGLMAAIYYEWSCIA
eukprot:scaffold2771_cov31-Tisochrysis_lutea.AAC.2